VRLILGLVEQRCTVRTGPRNLGDQPRAAAAPRPRLRHAPPERHGALAVSG